MGASISPLLMPMTLQMLLGSVQVLYKQVFPNSGRPIPPPLNKQNKHGLRPPNPDVQIVVQPGSLAARNYQSWQKLFGKIHALLSQIEDNGKN